MFPLFDQMKSENYNRIPMLSKDWPGMLLLKWYKTPDDCECKLAIWHHIKLNFQVFVCLWSFFSWRLALFAGKTGDLDNHHIFITTKSQWNWNVELNGAIYLHDDRIFGQRKYLSWAGCEKFARQVRTNDIYIAKIAQFQFQIRWWVFFFFHFFNSFEEV